MVEAVGVLRAALAGLSLAAWASGAGAAESVMVRCGQEYQAARSAGTLNGADWSAFRVACAERLKAAPAAAAPQAVNPPPAAATVPQPEASGVPSAGLAAMHARQKQCGAEWTAQKAALVAATPGLTWPRYWSQCNARLKAGR